LLYDCQKIKVRCPFECIAPRVIGQFEVDDLEIPAHYNK
jgi:hypothetical protein